MPFADIAVPAPIHAALSYRIPEGMALAPGMRVAIPFRRRSSIGICLAIRDELPPQAEGKEIKAIDGILDEHPVLSAPLLELLQWMAAYYCAPIGEVCRVALPARLLKSSGSRTTRPFEPHEMSPQRQEPVELTAEQRLALSAILASCDGAKPETFLLEGITGSGKTEVYLCLFEELDRRGQQGLLLVPEIGLTPQLTGRAASRFAGRVAVFHSGLTDAQRHAQWQRMHAGEADIAIGTRSALFAPLPRLGAIIVDEEHDASYKQDEGVSYSGRDGAVMRAHLEKIPIVLGSATPSLESLANVQRGKYRHLQLTCRPTGAALPSVEIVDMRLARKANDPEEQTEGMRRRRELVTLSPQLFDAIAETLARGEQVLLFTGRRGFAGALQCDACGALLTCPNCDIALTPHLARQGPRGRSFVLLCHCCDYRIPTPAGCTTCEQGTLVPIGHGTERLEGELADFFPRARIARFDSDSASSPVRRRTILGEMRRGRIDILVGTQMVTKGHDFPAITLVGVVSADVSLALPDFRAAERAFQLLTQVAGRAGRGDRPGRVIIQTRQPEHASFRSAQQHDIAGFAAQELPHRLELAYPPYSRMANIRLSSTNEARAATAATKASRLATSAVAAVAGGEQCRILGPAPAPIRKIRGRYRWQLLIKSPTAAILGKVLCLFRQQQGTALPPGVRIAIDVDPIHLL